MTIAGTSPDGHIVEMIEIKDHPFYEGTQGHPEFKSRPNHAHPLFRGFVKAADEYAKLKLSRQAQIRNKNKRSETGREKVLFYSCHR